MVFQVNEDKLKNKLKFYIPIGFLIVAAVSVGSYSILLKTIYQQASSLRGYVYIFILFLALGIAVSMFFDCIKVEKGKSIPLGKIYVIKSGVAVILVAIASYTIYILDGSVTLFEILNIRLIMVTFLISIAMSVASVLFNIVVRPLYKSTGQREYHLPMIYNFLPVSMATIIFVVTLVNGMHYRAELSYDRAHDIILKKQYANDFANSFTEIVGKYVTASKNIANYINLVSITRYNLNDYTEIMNRYLITRHANDSNIKSFSIFFNDLENVNINIAGQNIENISVSWQYDINNLMLINTNSRPNVSANNLNKLSSNTNSVIDITQNSDTFYIHTPILIDNKNVGFVSLEVRNSIYIDILNNADTKKHLNIFITDSLYSIVLSNNPAVIGDMQRYLDDKTLSSSVKDYKNDNYKNSITGIKLIELKEPTAYVIKYLLFDSIYVINYWKQGIAYKDNTLFRSTIIKSSVTIYLGLLAFLIVILVLILSLRKTLVFAKNVSESLSEGEGDLTIRLPVISNNESGELVHSFNKFLDKVKNNIVIIKNNAYKLTGNIQNMRDTLTGNIQNMRASISISISDFNTIYKEFETELINSTKIAESSANAARVSFMQRTRFTAVNETVQLLLDNINDINDKMKQQSESVSRTIGSVQHMMANIVTVSHGATKANDYAKILYTEAQDGSSIGESVVSSINNIKEYSKQITNITQVIHNIAELQILLRLYIILLSRQTF